MNERLSRIVNSPLRIPVGVGVVSLGIGIGLGYILGKKKATYYVLPESEQLEMNFSPEPQIWEPIEEHHETPVTAPEFKERVNDFIADKLKTDILSNHGDEPEEDEIKTRSIFAHTDDEWDYEIEVAKRSSGQPYVLHKDEFYADENGYTQSTLTYYAGDNILVDEDDTPIYNHDVVTGPLLFGHGSGDPNVVHIRNDKRKAEYEIIKDPGLYSVEILGLDIEKNDRVKDIKHSSNRRFRME